MESRRKEKGQQQKEAKTRRKGNSRKRQRVAITRDNHSASGKQTAWSSYESCREQPGAARGRIWLARTPDQAPSDLRGPGGGAWLKGRRHRTIPARSMPSALPTPGRWTSRLGRCNGRTDFGAVGLVAAMLGRPAATQPVRRRVGRTSRLAAATLGFPPSPPSQPLHPVPVARAPIHALVAPCRPC